MHRDAGHPDYQKINMEIVARRAEELTPTDEPAVPSCLLEMLDEEEDESMDDTVDKAATLAERVWNEPDIAKEMARTRPQLLLSQRDSDAQKNVEASRMNALATVSRLEVCTGSALIDQFNTSYIPRVFNLTLPWCVGGPDFPRQTRWRRKFDDAPT